MRRELSRTARRLGPNGAGKTTIKLLMVQDLGWVFDARVGLHIDVFPSAFVSEHDPVSFMMPVKRATKAENC